MTEARELETYNFPQSRITDHRINFSSHALHETLYGNLDDLIAALTKEDQNRKLEEMLKVNEQ